MSGFAGYCHLQGLPPFPAVLPAMAKILAHRGPDHTGFFQDRCCALTACEQTIMHQRTGLTQPFIHPTSGQVILFDGALSNLQKLRTDLVARGHTCESDQETLIAAYNEWNETFVSHIDGMFALGLWDPGKQTLLLARDRLGQKPLFYCALPDNTLIFASEIKAILCFPGVSRTFNALAMDRLLDFGFNLAPSTFLESVQQLMPGHTLTHNFQGSKIRCYWQLSPVSQTIQTQQAAEGLYDHLMQATKNCLMADQPIAAYLSGGIDSSAVAAMYALQTKEPINTLSITFEEADYDERHFARLVSQVFNTKHHEFICTIDEKEIENLIWFLETPLVTLLNLPLYLLSRQIKEMGFPIVLSGDGADEILGGYSYFKILKAMNFIGHHESPTRANLLRRIWPDLGNQDQAWMRYRMLKNFPITHPALPYRWQTFQFKGQLLSDTFLEKLALHQNVRQNELPIIPTQLSLLDQALYFETTMRLPNLTLALADTMSMANSVQLRSPFMDHRLVEYLFSIPGHLKMRGLNEKFLLKRALKNFLPQEICTRPKQPLAPPGKWFVKKFRTLIGDILSYQNVQAKGYFRPEFMEYILKEFDHNSPMDYSGVIIVAFFVHLFDHLFLSSPQGFSC